MSACCAGGHFCYVPVKISCGKSQKIGTILLQMTLVICFIWIYTIIKQRVEKPSAFYFSVFRARARIVKSGTALRFAYFKHCFVHVHGTKNVKIEATLHNEFCLPRERAWVYNKIMSNPTLKMLERLIRRQKWQTWNWSQSSQACHAAQ